MNTLAYAILSTLANHPCSGYELAEHLDALWPAKHSQIYPLLKKLHQDGLLTFEHVMQTDKPNKKIFSITEKGKKELENWIAEPPAISVTRDEFFIKMYASWLVNEEDTKKLINERLTEMEHKIALRKASLSKAEYKDGEQDPNKLSKHFGPYILLNRKLRLEKEEFEWCKWVLTLLEKMSFNTLLFWFISGKFSVIKEMAFI
ncbi:PadR family transcriptional regulator [Scopulibacillus darangshiensis]|uniref:PadR family transcriptional regulator n=1 Tax=Scopulibacillus darangshiensis TaxID=442528 RepID=A0A4V2SNF3_9BACL|nr:PadR family transcriptional regulator [Scopulibacillus darangshiensis]TCP30846.1 PadR family transcriptional regulator [Scopulibacillus darangshiensis]